MTQLGWGLLLVVCACLTGFSEAQAGDSSLQFRFVRPGLAVPEYTLELREMGGSYRAQNATAPAANRYSMAPVPGPAETVQQFRLLPVHFTRVMELVRQTNGLKGCASRARGIADTGTKTLTWHEADGSTLACTYNYSESRSVVELTTILEAMAATLDEGRKLEQLHRFDRLGLDAEMALLTEAVVDGRAQATETIAPTLQSLVNDPEVLARVRNRAAKLLAENGSKP